MLVAGLGAQAAHALCGPHRGLHVLLDDVANDNGLLCARPQAQQEAAGSSGGSGGGSSSRADGDDEGDPQDFYEQRLLKPLPVRCRRQRLSC
jgi:hypothetical protein